MKSCVPHRRIQLRTLWSFFLIVVLFGCSAIGQATATNSCAALQEREEAGSEFVFNVFDQLKKDFYDPDSLKPVELFNASLDGLAKHLKSKNLNFSPEKIPADSDYPAVKAKFAAEFGKAGKLAAGIVLEKHELAFTAAHMLLAAVGDSHTSFIEPKLWDTEKKETSGAAMFSGISVSLRKLEDNFFCCDWVFPDGPADKAGVKRFDRIVLVNGEPAGNDTAKLAERIRGLRGTEVKLTIERNNERKEFSIKRGDIIQPSTSETVIKDGSHSFGYLHIYSFMLENSWKETLRHAMFKEGVDKVGGFIIDLRGNPGGYLHVLEKILQVFLEAGTKCFVTKNTSGESEFIVPIGPMTRLPLVVLVDESSASASEIMSGVLQEQGRAVIVGKKTAGAVSVGQRVELPFESAMSVAVYQFFTAKGKKLEKEGVTPDVAVENTKDDITKGRDVQLERAVETLKEKVKKE